MYARRGKRIDVTLCKQAKSCRTGGSMSTEKLAVAVFGGGCFWCVEAVFDELHGVRSVVSGYAGGETKNPTYEQVCSGRTGHAEVIKIEYDPAEISFRELMTVFFATHDPTTLNRQGNDVGTQYRSTIFYADDEQKQQAAAFIKELDEAKSFKNSIVTTLEPLTEFYPAEDYHQKFYANNPYQPYCQYMIPPKLSKLHKQFKELLKSHGPSN
jgi:peptide-methionine (S)-S-oxide reductase